MNRENILKIGMAGCGEHSHVHARAAEKIPFIKIASCCDVMEKKAMDWAQKYKCSSYYKDLETMLKNERLDAVILCTWPSQHYEQIGICLKNGMKNILCEKSLAMTGDEAFSIWKMIKKEKAFLMEACMNRHHPVFRKLAELISSGRTGAVDSVRAVFNNYEPGEGTGGWRQKTECGGGVPHDWMSYTVNACNYFSGGMPVKVFAEGDDGKDGIINRVYGMIHYDNGVAGIIENSKKANFSEELQITCANGILKLPVAWGLFGNVAVTLQKRVMEKWPYTAAEKYRIGKKNSYVLQLRNFAGAVRGHEEPVMPLRQSVVNIYTIEALVSSVLGKKAVGLKIPDLNEGE